ncbi:helix-turn-helix transcriptional regulator [Ochrobactrum sp. GPK 3]
MSSNEELNREPEVDLEFARRLERACDMHPRVPPMFHGRHAWIKTELELHGVHVTQQTIQRWYSGLVRPRNRKMIALAKILGVDTAWLSTGRGDESSRKAVRTGLTLDGAQNCVMGFVQIAGWACAFPEPDDENAEYVHFYAIIKGRQHRFHVSAGVDFSDGMGREFLVPIEYEKCTVVGAISTGPLSLTLLHLTPELIAKHGDNLGHRIKLNAIKDGQYYMLGDDRIPIIDSFAESVI